MISLSACIITKNSVHLIEKTLKSIWNVVDEIIIVDRGSSDGTIDKALKFTDRVYSFENRDYEKIVEFAAGKATKEYIFLLNPGEFINENQVDMLNALKEKNTLCKNGYKVKYNIRTIEETLSFYIGRIIKKDRTNNYKNIVLDWFDLENLQSIDLDVESNKYNDGKSDLNKDKTNVLIGSVIKEDVNILKEFFIALENLDKSHMNIEYIFIDNNDKEESSQLLKYFKANEGNITIINQKDIITSKYNCPSNTCHFENESIDEKAQLKNNIINCFLDKGYDYLFLVDSNVIFHEKTLKKLIEDDKDIISNIVFTKCNENLTLLPQVWAKDNFILHSSILKKNVRYEDIPSETMEFFDKLRKPGVYKVGGIGKCTLIKREPLMKGIKFLPLYNIESEEEYSHFSIKAVALGYDLYVDTEYPSYEIYKELNLRDLNQYKMISETREFELNQYKINDLISKGIQALQNAVYDIDEDDSFAKYFTLKEAARQKLIIDKERTKSIKDNKDTECRTLGLIISMESNKVTGTVDFIDWENDNEINKCYFKCLKQDNNWLISELNIVKEEN